MTTDEIKQQAEAMGKWYHAIRLSPDYVTPSYMDGSMPVWDATRRARHGISYAGATVLDIASLEGMWAFEAEDLGARTVIASDKFQMCGAEMFDRFCFARFIRKSKVGYVVNADVHDLPNRMGSVMRAWGITGGFDIIQCTGLLYHIQHPLLALQQIRRCCDPFGTLLLETACTDKDDSSLRFNYDKKFYDDDVTYWIPSVGCLKEMLAMSGFRVREGSIEHGRPDRVSLVADAVDFDDREARLG